MEKFSSFGFFKLRSESREKPKVLNVRSAFSMCGNYFIDSRLLDISFKKIGDMYIFIE